MADVKARMQEAARQAEAELHEAYLAACDDAGQALHPAHDLGLPSWACDMLAEAYDTRAAEN